VARWRAGELAGRWLRTMAGEPLRVVFAGRPGGPAGPDFRDAVLARADGSRVYGDVELHLRAAGWWAHGHAADHRYDRVVLHVVARAEGARATPLASGAWAPLVEFGATEAPGVASSRAESAAVGAAPGWPCQRPGGAPPGELRAVLLAAGEARFAGRVVAFGARLADATGEPRGHWRSEDRVLLVALAEGLAYGRDRSSLREAGEWLAAGGTPDALTRELPRLPRLDATRLEGLLALVERWGEAGPWAALWRAIGQLGSRADSLPPSLLRGGAGGEVTPGLERRANAAAARDALALDQRLSAALTVPGGALSAGRALILLANVVLPCGVAVAGRAGDAPLAARLWAAYRALPGLPGNQITRAMARQLGLARAPAGACAQQGLHHLWANHCREKRCGACPCAARPTTALSPAVYCGYGEDV
jgi:hypothetical protein